MSRVVGGKAGHGWAGKRTCWVLPAVANNFVQENTYCLVIYFVGNPQPAAAPPLSSEGLVESLPKLNQGRRQWTCTTSFTGMPHVPCMSREAWVFFFLAIQPSMVRTTVEAFQLDAGRPYGMHTFHRVNGPLCFFPTSLCVVIVFGSALQPSPALLPQPSSSTTHTHN